MANSGEFKMCQPSLAWVLSSGQEHSMEVCYRAQEQLGEGFSSHVSLVKKTYQQVGLALDWNGAEGPEGQEAPGVRIEPQSA